MCLIAHATSRFAIVQAHIAQTFHRNSVILQCQSQFHVSTAEEYSQKTEEHKQIYPGSLERKVYLKSKSDTAGMRSGPANQLPGKTSGTAHDRPQTLGRSIAQSRYPQRCHILGGHSPPAGAGYFLKAMHVGYWAILPFDVPQAEIFGPALT